jgi:hypothetical protein
LGALVEAQQLYRFGFTTVSGDGSFEALHVKRQALR